MLKTLAKSHFWMHRDSRVLVLWMGCWPLTRRRVAFAHKRRVESLMRAVFYLLLCVITSTSSYFIPALTAVEGGGQRSALDARANSACVYLNCFVLLCSLTQDLIRIAEKWSPKFSFIFETKSQTIVKQATGQARSPQILLLMCLSTPGVPAIAAPKHTDTPRGRAEPDVDTIR